MVRKKLSKSKAFFSLSLGMIMLIQSAFAMWNVGSFGFAFSGEKSGARGVAVISNAPTVFYTTVEKALEVANSVASANNPLTVYVLPREKSDKYSNFVEPIYITEDVEVKANVTLRLPFEYEYDTSSGIIINSSYDGYQTSSNIADSTAAGVINNRTTQLVIGDGKKLTIDSGASLLIDGVLGGGGGGQPNGQTCGLYSEISLGRGSSIICNGNMEVRGYVKAFDESYDDTCVVDIGASSSGSILKLPLVNYDFVGGSQTINGTYPISTSDIIGSIQGIANWDGCLWNGIFPMEIYDLPNVSVPYVCHSGSQVFALYDIYIPTAPVHASGEIPLFASSNAILNFTSSSGNQAEIDYDSAIYFENDGRKEGLTYNDSKYISEPSSSVPGSADRDYPTKLLNSGNRVSATEMLLRGSFSTGDIELDFKIVDSDLIYQKINTAGGKIGLKNIITGEPGALSKEYGRLLFPFSYKWTVEACSGNVSVPTACKFLPGSTFIVDEGAGITVDSGGTLVFFEGVGTPTSSYYPSTFKDSYFINNGTLTVLNGGSFGGTIRTFDSNYGEYDESSKSYVVFESDDLSNYQVGVHSIGWKTTNSSGHYEYSQITFDAKAYFAPDVSEPLVSEDPVSLYGQGKAFSGHVPSSVSQGKGYLVKDKVDIQNVVISVNGSSSTGDGDSGTFRINSTVLPEDHGSDIVSYDWKVSPDAGVNITKYNDGSADITIPGSDSDQDKYYEVTLTVGFIKSDGTSASLTSNVVVLTATGTCLSGDTQIRMADGSVKRLDSIGYDDDILAWDHVTGRVVSTKASIVFRHNYGYYDSIVLHFDDGSKLEVLNAHELFDITTNSYVSIDSGSYSKYIGHSFAKMKGGPGSASYESVRLISADVSMKQTNAYSIQSARYINFLACDFLTRTMPAVDGWFDYFELGENLTYDPVKMQADIEKYGLYEYETFKPYGVSYQQFIDFNGPWLKVLVGKGVVTFEQIIDLIYEYVV